MIDCELTAYSFMRTVRIFLFSPDIYTKVVRIRKPISSVPWDLPPTQVAPIPLPKRCKDWVDCPLKGNTNGTEREAYFLWGIPLYIDTIGEEQIILGFSPSSYLGVYFEFKTSLWIFYQPIHWIITIYLLTYIYIYIYIHSSNNEDKFCLYNLFKILSSFFIIVLVLGWNW